MSQTIDPHILYSQSPFFLDYIEGKQATSQAFAHSIDSLAELAQRRTSIPSQQTRSNLCTKLLNYNRNLDASSNTIANIERLRDSETLCVIGGQQAEFLGGPLFVLYKIVSIIQTATWLSERLARPVIPVFWLASEDHDFAEINHTRWIDNSGALRTIAFDWDAQGAAIEQLPISDNVHAAFNEARKKIPFFNEADAAVFDPTADDDFSTWHARTWSRLFAAHGLVIVEPHVLRPLANTFFTRALNEQREVRESLTRGAQQLEASGYPVLLDPEQSGGLFTLTENGPRSRISDLSNATFDAAITYSADAALRPLLADSLFPTIANILGPSELAYHAMLRPLYERWQIPQPLAVPRQGATLLSNRDSQVLSGFNINLSKALEPAFKPADAAKRMASKTLQSAFRDARSRTRETLLPLQDVLRPIDIGLEARWDQTVDQVEHQLNRLEDRAVRADLARRGLSVKSLQALKLRLLPMEKPQERILSGFSWIAQYGVQWIHDMIASGEPRCDNPTRFRHQLIVLEDSHE